MKTNIIKKRLAIFTFILAFNLLFLVNNVYTNRVYADSYSLYVLNENQLKQSDIKPQAIWYTEDKTVTVRFPSVTSIPQSYYYEYYHPTIGWMGGYLKLVDYEKSGSEYIATFSGKVGCFIW